MVLVVAFPRFDDTQCVQLYEHRVHCECGRELVLKAEGHLWTEACGPSNSPPRAWGNAVPVTPIPPQEHSSHRNASSLGYGRQEAPWTMKTEDPWTVETQASAATLQTHTGAGSSGSWENTAQKFDPWNLHDEPNGSGTREHKKQKLPLLKWEPKFTPNPLQKCLQLYRRSNRAKDDIRRCDQCNAWPKQTYRGMPVVLCGNCWRVLSQADWKLHKEYTRQNDIFNTHL